MKHKHILNALKNKTCTITELDKVKAVDSGSNSDWLLHFDKGQVTQLIKKKKIKVH